MDTFGTVITLLETLLLPIITLNSLLNQPALTMQRNHLTSREMVFFRRLTSVLEQSLDQRGCEGMHGQSN
jgi:hypothetical protein